jgi:hypothetical protein
MWNRCVRYTTDLPLEIIANTAKD